MTYLCVTVWQRSLLNDSAKRRLTRCYSNCLSVRLFVWPSVANAYWQRRGLIASAIRVVLTCCTRTCARVSESRKPVFDVCDADYESCTKQMKCSKQCVVKYARRYASECTGGRTPTCEDYARVHNGGPKGCRHDDTLSYWQRVKRCCGPDCSSSSHQDQRSSSSSVPRQLSISVCTLMMFPSIVESAMSTFWRNWDFDTGW